MPVSRTSSARRLTAPGESEAHAEQAATPACGSSPYLKRGIASSHHKVSELGVYWSAGS
jgi:hypothetical protein